ncbi:MAG: phosphate/phosphite/phosphonate ABC transporter substrate-binding protein [Gammaproteobacteria bacterium]|nr:phosphate/phosphite/phosphonate ABC transporter substrate-binding protein [Gammaproteobacteria bacterium]
MGIISLSPPAKVYREWQPFVEYLSERSGLNIEIVVPKGFNKIKEAIDQGSIDIFYVNSHIYYLLASSKKAQPIAQMVNINNSTLSYAVIFVNKNSEVKTIDQLKGETVSFVAPMAAGGYLAPRAKFYSSGLPTKTSLKEEFTGNLTSSIHKVILGDSKAGVMCGASYKLMTERLRTGDLLIIGESEPYPENVIGARTTLDKNIVKNLSQIITHMDLELKGAQVLQDMYSMKIQKFQEYDPKMELITKELMNKASM